MQEQQFETIDVMTAWTIDLIPMLEMALLTPCVERLSQDKQMGPPRELDAIGMPLKVLKALHNDLEGLIRHMEQMRGNG